MRIHFETALPCATFRVWGVALRAKLAVALCLLLQAVAAPSIGWAQTSGSATATASDPMAPMSPTAEYRLGAGDLLRISVYQNPDLSLEARISEAGVISYPLLGSVKLGQSTASEAERLIADGLRNGNFVKKPQVSVLVMQVRGNQVSVIGQVNRPGRFPIEVADMRLTDLMAAAGGVATTGTDRVTLVGVRDGRPFRAEVDLPRVFTAAGRGDDIAIQGGDVVWVDRAPAVYIYGEVQRPGTLRLERGMTVLQALAAGGGLTLRGTEKGIRVHRRAPEGRALITQPAMDDLLRDGDVVFVRESLF